jgi:hypothetical protein
LLRQSEFWGSPHSTWFNGLEPISSSPRASVLSFRGGSRLDPVSLTLTDGTNFTHGWTGGTAVSLTLRNPSTGLPQNFAWAKRVERRGASIFRVRHVLEMPFLLALLPAISQLSRLLIDGKLLDFLDRIVMR